MHIVYAICSIICSSRKLAESLLFRVLFGDKLMLSRKFGCLAQFYFILYVSFMPSESCAYLCHQLLELDVSNQAKLSAGIRRAAQSFATNSFLLISYCRHIFLFSGDEFRSSFIRVLPFNLVG